MDPMVRMVYRFEFLTYLGTVLRAVVEVCNLITVAKERGFLAGVPLAKGSEPAS